MTGTAYKRPESILVVICTTGGEVLMLRRCVPADFWQSVTGSLQVGETLMAAAAREVREETGIRAGNRLEDMGVENRFRIWREWRPRYAPAVEFNLEHVLRLRLPERCPVRLNPTEHVEYRWVAAAQAAELAGSPTNAEAIRRFAG
ncbi:MAG TPA: dihydroneopterin triphosphate diphosphatase [Gammaproteobacteria bacterium]|nr:dihydroneopterin triphosphate diphosphatase [Gammaproteobacteria bacterium]